MGSTLASFIKRGELLLTRVELQQGKLIRDSKETRSLHCSCIYYLQQCHVCVGRGWGRPAVLRGAAPQSASSCHKLLTMISMEPRRAHRVAHRRAVQQVRMNRRSLARLPNVGGCSTTTGLVGTNGASTTLRSLALSEVRTRGSTGPSVRASWRARLLAETCSLSPAQVGRKNSVPRLYWRFSVQQRVLDHVGLAQWGRVRLELATGVFEVIGLSVPDSNLFQHSSF